MTSAATAATMTGRTRTVAAIEKANSAGTLKPSRKISQTSSR